MSDLVKRLRRATTATGMYGVCNEAANEIDRLRGQLAEARELLVEWRGLRGTPLILASLTDTWLAASSEPPQ